MTSKRPNKEKIVASALKLASLRDWDTVTMTDIATEAEVSLADLAELFDGRDDILISYGRMIDRDVLAAFPDGISGDDARDRVFDVMMERFDRLNQDRDALLSIMKGFCSDPKDMVISAPYLGKSMAWMLEVCGVETTGWKGAMRVLGLTGIYFWVLRTWRDDETEDLSKTMAALDKALSRCDSLCERLGL